MSYAEYWRSGPYRSIPQQHVPVGRSGAQMFRIENRPSGAYDEPPMPSITLQLCVGGRSDVTVDLGAGRIAEHCGAGSWIVAPGGQRCRFEIGTPIDLQIIEFPETVLDQAGVAPDDLRVLHSRISRDEVVAPLAAALWSECERPSGLGALWEDQALLTLAGLLRRAAKPSRPAEKQAGLAPWQLRRAIEYLRDHLADEVPLATLARAANLSTFHFARAFKRSVGLPPHAYHSALRLDEARRLLVETEMSVTDIALAIGYETPQTLGRLFQRQIGTTPTAYRRDRRG